MSLYNGNNVNSTVVIVLCYHTQEMGSEEWSPWNLTLVLQHDAILCGANGGSMEGASKV